MSQSVDFLCDDDQLRANDADRVGGRIKVAHEGALAGGKAGCEYPRIKGRIQNVVGEVGGGCEAAADPEFTGDFVFDSANSGVAAGRPLRQKHGMRGRDGRRRGRDGRRRAAYLMR